jgi:16S rRNA (guanine966-N2)-methyltransferase
MRITGGTFGGRALKAPRDMAVRPTSDKVRQAIFNILQHNDFGAVLEGARAADLFAGTGALGIEALSHGASFCLFVDDAAESRALIRDNIEALELTGASKIWRRDATKLGPMAGALSREVGTGSRQKARPQISSAGGPFELVFLDPPYRKGLIAPTLASLREGGWLTDGAVLVAETALDDDAPSTDGFMLLDERAYGDTRVLFLGA